MTLSENDTKVGVFAPSNSEFLSQVFLPGGDLSPICCRKPLSVAVEVPLDKVVSSSTVQNGFQPPSCTSVKRRVLPFCNEPNFFARNFAFFGNFVMDQDRPFYAVVPTR